MRGNEPPIIVRAASIDDVDQLSAVHLAAWLSAYRGICADSFLDSLTTATFDGYHRPRFDPQGSPDVAEPFIVACDAGSGAVVGFARGGPTRKTSPTGDPLPEGFATRYSSELYAIYVHPGRQGRGAGALLFSGLVDRLVALRHGSMCLWVLSENRGARSFYERMGGSPAGESIITLASVSYPQIAYAWANLGGKSR